MRGGQAGRGESAVPLSPRRVGLVGEVPSFDRASALPASVSRIQWLVERRRSVGSVADIDVVDGADVNVESWHLRDGGAFERRDQPRDAAVLAGADHVDRAAVVE